jgi:hypothetical protein
MHSTVAVIVTVCPSIPVAAVTEPPDTRGRHQTPEPPHGGPLPPDQRPAGPDPGVLCQAGAGRARGGRREAAAGGEANIQWSVVMP